MNEAQHLLDAAFSGTLDLDADASSTQATPETTPTSANPATPTDPVAPVNNGSAAAAAQDDEPAGAPIASKSGGYTIPYEKLTEARTDRDVWKARAEESAAELAQLKAIQAQNLANAQAEADARSAAGTAPTAADTNLALAQQAIAQGVNADVFGDFSEEALAKGVALTAQSLVAASEQRITEQVERRLAEALAPFQKSAAQTAEQQHFATIFGAHKDANEIMDSAEFADWIKAQPSYARGAIEQALNAGTAAQVVEVFDSFKTQTGKLTPAGTTQADPVKAAIEKANGRVAPASLSDLPGVPLNAGIAAEAERVSAMASDPAALLNHMGNLSAAKLEALMNSVV